jgi:hypothetical protein
MAGPLSKQLRKLYIFPKTLIVEAVVAVADFNQEDKQKTAFE